MVTSNEGERDFASVSVEDAFCNTSEKNRRISGVRFVSLLDVQGPLLRRNAKPGSKARGRRARIFLNALVLDHELAEVVFHPFMFGFFAARPLCDTFELPLPERGCLRLEYAKWHVRGLEFPLSSPVASFFGGTQLSSSG